MRTISTPFRFYNGRVASSDDPREIARCQVLDVVTTAWYERVMRPFYGADLRGVIFNPMNEINLSEAKLRLMEAVASTVTVGWIVDVSFKVDQFTGPSAVVVTVHYTTPPDRTIQTTTTALSGIVTQGSFV